MLNNTFENCNLLFERCTLVCSGVILPMDVYPALFIITVQISHLAFIGKSCEIHVAMQVIGLSCP